jgi:hypothetical protein
MKARQFDVEFVAAESEGTARIRVADGEQPDPRELAREIWRRFDLTDVHIINIRQVA